jgi:hypothetical protein
MLRLTKLSDLTTGDHYAETYDGEDECLLVSLVPMPRDPGFYNLTALSLTHTEIEHTQVHETAYVYLMETPDAAELSVHLEMAAEFGPAELVTAVTKRHEETALRELHAVLARGC